MTARQAENNHSDSTSTSGREAQRRRTRRAILEAAQRLMARGEAVTADAVASEADMSRRTVYLYFPAQEQLVLDATLGRLTEAEGTMDTAWQTKQQARDRILGLLKAVLSQSDQTLPLGRQIIQQTATQSGEPGKPVRGYRRMQWIEEAVQPLRVKLNDEQYSRLISSLAIVIGFESMMVLRDVRGTGEKTEREVLAWMVDSLMETMEREASEYSRFQG